MKSARNAVEHCKLHECRRRADDTYILAAL